MFDEHAACREVGTTCECADWLKILFWHCVCVSLVIEGSNDILFYWLCICDSTEEIPSSAEKVQDCDVLLEPTLLGPLRGDGSTVSLSECSLCLIAFLLPVCLFAACIIFLILTSATSSLTSFPF